MNNLSFPKLERLNSKKEIESLFKEGSSFVEYPLKVIYNELGQKGDTQLLISVPKRRFKKAVSRNRIKRLVRESYRQNKTELIQKMNEQGKYFALAFVYIGKDIPKYASMNDTVQKVLLKLKSLN